MNDGIDGYMFAGWICSQWLDDDGRLTYNDGIRCWRCGGCLSLAHAAEVDQAIAQLLRETVPAPKPSALRRFGTWVEGQGPLRVYGVMAVLGLLLGYVCR